MNSSSAPAGRVTSILAALGLLLAFAGAAQGAAPFALQTPAGERIEFSGKSRSPATVLFFWATWCPYCKTLMPHLQSILDQYGSDVTLLAVNIMEDGDPAAFMAEAGYDWTLLLMGDDVAKTYRVAATPGVLVVDRRGEIVFDLRRVQLSATVGRRLEGVDSRPKAASRMAPFWAAELRRALDPLVRGAR